MRFDRNTLIALVVGAALGAYTLAIVEGLAFFIWLGQ